MLICSSATQKFEGTHPLTFEGNFIRSSPSKVFRRARNWIIRWLAINYQWATPTLCI